MRKFCFLFGEILGGETEGKRKRELGKVPPLRPASGFVMPPPYLFYNKKPVKYESYSGRGLISFYPY